MEKKLDASRSNNSIEAELKSHANTLRRTPNVRESRSMTSYLLINIEPQKRDTDSQILHLATSGLGSWEKFLTECKNYFNKELENAQGLKNDLRYFGFTVSKVAERCEHFYREMNYLLTQVPAPEDFDKVFRRKMLQRTNAQKFEKHGISSEKF